MLIEAQEPVLVRIVEAGTSVASATPTEPTLRLGEIADIELMPRMPENTDEVGLLLVSRAESARG